MGRRLAYDKYHRHQYGRYQIATPDTRTINVREKRAGGEKRAESREERMGRSKI